MGAELSATQDKGVEHDETENKGLESIVFVLLRLLPVCVRELIDSTTQVSLQVLWGLVGHFNGVLEDGLWNDLHVR